MTNAPQRWRYARRRPLTWLPWVLGLACLGLQIATPLLHGDTRRWVVIAGALAFFAASTVHALIHRGFPWTLGFVAVTVGGALAVEALGVRSGWPFGSFSYADTLGVRVAGVPVVVPLAWSAFAYPALLAGRRIGGRYAVLVGAIALASWDLFWDTAMVADGHWGFDNVTFTVHGVPSVPVSSFAGWFVVALVMMAVLGRLPRDRSTDTLPATLFLCTYLIAVVANATYLHSPAVAVVGGIAMGIVAVPYGASLWAARP